MKSEDTISLMDWNVVIGISANLLRLPSSACNAAVYGELGTFPLDLRKKIRMVKYWLRLSTHWDVSPLLQKAYQINISTKPSK